MSHQSDLISEDIQAYLAQHERKELLRFLTRGNVDDGKSTLIGRLLHDSKMIYEDHLEALTRDSKKVGTTGELKFTVAQEHVIDFATDGMPAVLSTPRLIGLLERASAAHAQQYRTHARSGSARRENRRRILGRGPRRSRRRHLA